MPQPRTPNPPAQLPLFPEQWTPEEARAVRVRAGRDALDTWLRALPCSEVRYTVQVEIGRIALVRRGESGPGTPYFEDRVRCIRFIKAAVTQGRDTRREERYARWEAGRRAVSAGQFDDFGQAVFGHLNGKRG